jgi:hypothetical protein
MGLAAAERDRPYITGFLRAPPDFPGIFCRIFVHSNAKKPDRQPLTARSNLVICDSLLRRYAGEMMTPSLFPVVRGLAILFGLFGRTAAAAIQWVSHDLRQLRHLPRRL